MKKLVLLATTAFLVACGQKGNPTNEGADSTSAPLATSVETVQKPEAEPEVEATLPNDYDLDISEVAKEEKPLVQRCLSLLQKWNEAINSHDINVLNGLYTNVVDYYGSCMEKDKVEQTQQKMFDKSPAFRQYIDNIKLAANNGCRAYFTFDKHVQTEPGGEFTTYHAYIHFAGYDTEWGICRESDATTDENNGRRNNNLKSVSVQKHTPLDQIFNAANVGKRIDTDYWTLVNSNEEDEDEGVLAAAMSQACDISCRLQMSGELKKNYRGRKNTYYIDGLCEAGESEFLLIWVYDANTGQLSCIQ